MKLLITFIFFLWSANVVGQGCEFDSQCRGNRICESGRCITLGESNFGSTDNQRSKGARTDISIDLTELVKEVANWAKGAVRRFDEIEKKRIKRIGSKLVKSLSELSGKKSALSTFLLSYDSRILGGGEPIDYMMRESNFERGLADEIDYMMRESKFKLLYSEKIGELNKILEEVIDSIKELDPQWSTDNPTASFDAFRVTEQKKELLREAKLVNTYILSTENIKALSQNYMDESAQLLELSKTIASTLKINDKFIEN